VISPVNVADDMGVQFLDEGVDLGVQLQFCSLFLEVVVSLCLLECGLAVLADHHECRHEDRLKRDDKRQRWRHHWQSQDAIARTVCWWQSGRRPLLTSTNSG
jgi:hypothetical protein